MTIVEFNTNWNQSTGFDGFPSAIETPETMTFDTFASGEHFRYQDADGARYVKVKNVEADEFELYEEKEGVVTQY